MHRTANILDCSWFRLLLGGLLAVCIWLAPAALPGASPSTAAYPEGEAIAGFKPIASARDVCTRLGLELVREFSNLAGERRLCHVRAATTLTTAEIVARLKAEPTVEFAEPNYRRTLAAMPVPNDTQFPKQWPLQNLGQSVNGFPGAPGADIRFLAAWGMAKPDAGEIVVGILDSGIDLIHPDVAPNLWTNPGEIPWDSVDNDANGRVDDVNGYDFADGDAEPSDLVGHGTHLAGVIAAAANNAQGIAGTDFHARLLPLKITHNDGTLNVDAELAAIDYAVMMRNRGVNIVALNASFAGEFESFGEREAIQAAAAVGIVFCAAAGNGNSDNTAVPVFPANHRISNMIVVAASDSTDQLDFDSNYGTKVDLAAPGVDIYSAKPVWPVPYVSGSIPPVAATLTHGATPIPATAAVYSATTTGITATLHDCGYGSSPADFPPAVNGNIALIQRGNGTFATKVAYALLAGAKAAVIYNNTTGLVTANLNAPGKWIPAQSISQADGQALLAALPTTVTLANIPDQSRIYFFAAGTSAATPFVSAAVAFAARNFPNESASQRVARILNGVTPVGYLTGKVLTGGRLNLAGIVDPGGNDLPDWWETQYFGVIGINPSADPDEDHFTNLQEYRIGTQPDNPASKLAISKTAIVENSATRDFQITFPTATDVTYLVEFSDDLAAPSWTALGNDLAGTGTPATVTDPNAVKLHPTRFYRVRIIAP